ncbi:MAG TPA: sensor histidine kinase [Mycobacteriales bacterium]|nr:sensor histidine kinase [Mycobacteriales bacterium]
MRAMLWVVWLAGVAVTVLHALRPHGLVLHSPASAGVVETAVACAAMLLAALFLGRWQQRGLLLDLGTSFALTVLAVAKLAFTVVPLAHGGTVPTQILVAALLCGAAAAVLLALAALAPDRQTRWRSSAELILFVIGVGGAVMAVAALASSRVGAFPGLSGPPTTDAAGDGAISAVTLVQAAAALAFGIASVGYARRARMSGDPFYGWMAICAALWALARVNYAWTPASLAADLTIGDWLRMAGYGVAILAASYEFTGYWRRLAQVAVLEERRRLARELHDGLAQELAFVATQARMLSRRSGDPEAEVLAHAAERALDESRRGIGALTRPLDEPLDVSLAQQAEELSSRLGVRVLLDLEPVGQVPADTREALLRIAREAITNAGRHAHARRIKVQLSNHVGVTLRVSDDGRGFLVDDPRATANGRYGLTGMRERAEALGGSMRLESRPYAGTKVEVWVP